MEAADELPEDSWTQATINQWTPERIQSVEPSERGMPPGPWVNDSFLFGGSAEVHAGRSHVYGALTAVKPSLIQSRLLPGAVKDQYAAYHADLHVGAIIPVLGRLYCVDSVSKTGKLSAFRLTEQESPGQIVLRPRRYAFPLWHSAQGAPDRCATLSKRAIRVADIRLAEGNGKAYRARVGVTRKEVRGPLRQTDEFTWTWVRVGDDLKIGDHHCQVLSIVPPDDEDRTIRDKPCRLIGWIEIHATPTDLPHANSKQIP